jgi:hypothetical protein
MKRAISSCATSPDSDLGLQPIRGDEEKLFAARSAPSFEEQIAHARALLLMARGRQPDHPPRNDERFEM